MARVANRARRDMSHEVGEMVWLATKNLPLRTGTRKLAAIWAGPYEVVECVGPVVKGVVFAVVVLGVYQFTCSITY